MIHLYSLISIIILVGLAIYLWRQNEEEKKQRKLREASWLLRSKEKDAANAVLKAKYDETNSGIKEETLKDYLERKNK